MSTSARIPDARTKAALDELETKLQGMVEENLENVEFWAAFTRKADKVVRSASPNDREYAQGRVDCMLKNAGMIPGEDEGEPCK